MSVKPAMVRVVSRSKGEGRGREIHLQVGAETARRCQFAGAKHNCCILVGSGDDRGRVAIQINDKGGDFTASRKSIGSYEIVLREQAAKLLFRLQFDPIEREASLVPGGGQRGPVPDVRCGIHHG